MRVNDLRHKRDRLVLAIESTDEPVAGLVEKLTARNRELASVESLLEAIQASALDRVPPTMEQIVERIEVCRAVNGYGPDGR